VEKNYTVEVSVTQGGLLASMRVVPAAPDQEVTSIQLSDLYDALQKQGVTRGVWDEVLRQIVEEKPLGKWITIANGEPPGEGKDGYVLYHFNKGDPKANLKEDVRGRVNIRDMNLIQNVSKGDLLCELVPPENGKSGISVRGEEILGKVGAPAKLPKGNNTEVSEDGCKLLAGIDGMVVWTDSAVNVEPVYMVEKVDSSTGNIRFNGSVVVNGEVGDGYEIHALEDVTVAMSVGRVVINSNGNIRISGGVLGQEKAVITAGGSIRAKFIQDAHVKAVKEIVVEDYIRNSQVTAGGPVIIRNPQGWITGSTVSSESWIYCHTTGNISSPVDTRLIIGQNPALCSEREQRRQEVVERIGDFLKLSSSLGKLRNMKAKGSLSRQQEELYQKILDAMETLRHNLWSMDARINELTNKLNAVHSGNIYVDGVVNEGTMIMIGKAAREVREPRTKTQFSLQNGEIVESEFVMLPEIKEYLESE
jgi:uncharacterized protein (DUF342 family)